jgi:hypothetical protein
VEGGLVAAVEGTLGWLLSRFHPMTGPRQAPDLFAPVNAVPSLQVAVTVGVLCACAAPLGRISPATRATDNKRFRIRPVPHERCRPSLYWPRERFVQPISILPVKVHRLPFCLPPGPACHDIDLLASLANDKCHYTFLR